MKVLLIKQVPGTGQAGEIKDVSDGFVRNHLVPHGLAQVLTKHTLAMLEAQRKKRERLVKTKARERGKLAEKLDRRKFTLFAKADGSGTLYAGIDRRDIAAALRAEGFDVSPTEIGLEQAIKKVGTHSAELSIGGKTVAVKIEVVKIIK